jgi:hypothetical protein
MRGYGFRSNRGAKYGYGCSCGRIGFATLGNFDDDEYA